MFFFENKSLLLMCGTCQIEIILGKTDKFDKWMAAGSATAEEWEAVEAEEQN
jgi:ferredoxin